ncbi:MAG: ATP-NAD kinase family protein, partial [Candidatus Methanomethyliaceae archaeon]|nr:ATP-NAD kinase family protein [Candidatus Methanomethyliaceae archaeon]
SVGLKGTDGDEILERAIKLGAKKVSIKRAEEFLSSLGTLANTIEFWTCPGEMGEEIFNKLNIRCKIIPGRIGKTTAEDTKNAAKYMLKLGLSIITFCGGDGTARDILDAIGTSMPVIGIPAGVKMHGGIFAVTPRAAAELLIKYLWDELPVKEVEVADVDEEAYRAGRLSSRLYGYLLTPYEPDSIQGMKAPTPIKDDVMENMKAIAKWIVDNMEEDVIYILGPGTTVKSIMDLLGLEGTLLGVDLILNKKMLKQDVNEEEILHYVKGRRAKIIVSPIGRQGFIFGRGNQQISPEVIRIVGKDNILVISTREKLKDIKVLRVDTGDTEVDKMFYNGIKVLMDYGIFKIFKVS